jgi:hypothetical protein
MDNQIIWNRHEVDGIKVALLAGRITTTCWLCGFETARGGITRDTDQWFASEAEALAAAYRLSMQPSDSRQQHEACDLGNVEP